MLVEWEPVIVVPSERSLFYYYLTSWIDIQQLLPINVAYVVMSVLKFDRHGQAFSVQHYHVLDVVVDLCVYAISYIIILFT